ncbi:hypothetical protein AJ80_01839 [Polytolypa hystricis UAMH7299]|uniref:Uncharacterized protein n=1 Tax=Polytolypa hystricis (strain UAMH7299) TaxID=1447883 RepID=A0A2B7YYX4_POLH7|nr:hypothetical protein AJ80_01839 [Polytolypa hystricis UAMH7299]
MYRKPTGAAGDPGTETTLDRILTTFSNLPDKTISDVMDIQGDYLCYKYVEPEWLMASLSSFNIIPVVVNMMLGYRYMRLYTDYIHIPIPGLCHSDWVRVPNDHADAAITPHSKFCVESSFEYEVLDQSLAELVDNGQAQVTYCAW